jgi:Zn finger protein HypA/HybF involved in hydrogenase expression
MDEHRLDGNAAGGELGEVFAFEMTTAEAACASCGSARRVGAQMAYMHGMGTIVRCATCDSALIRVVHGRGRYWLDLRGVKYLQIEET